MINDHKYTDTSQINTQETPQKYPILQFNIQFCDYSINNISYGWSQTLWVKTNTNRVISHPIPSFEKLFL